MWKAANYSPDNLAETIDMTREHYGDSWISDPGFLKWQYESNPAGSAVIQLARDEETDQLAGQYIVIPMRFMVDDETVIGTLSLNTLTRQNYSGQGIFTGLAKAVYQDCTEQGVRFCYGFPNPNSYPGFTKKLGFTDLGNVPLLLRPLNTKALVQKKLASWLAPLALPFQLFYNVKDRSDQSYEVYSFTAFNLSEVNAFWANVHHKYPIMGIRDEDYLRWRYFDIPLRDYQIYGVRQKNSSKLLGYIVGRCTEVDGMSSGMIVDFLFDPKHPATGRLLVHRLLNFFKENNMELAGSLMLPHTEESQALKAEGFFTCPKALEPQPFPVVYRRFNPSVGEGDVQKNGVEIDDLDSLLELKRWFLTMGDYDVI
ncbi:MAG TPA: GNAT family N-acetyltransferase [Desulfosporosinus sp.]|nr:GNAT family N-acetyltransferase [Desulfosporosinus sp.]